MLFHTILGLIQTQGIAKPGNSVFFALVLVPFGPDGKSPRLSQFVCLRETGPEARVTRTIHRADNGVSKGLFLVLMKFNPIPVKIVE